MYPFWDVVVAPIIDATAPTHIVEIGALRGDTTARLLDTLGPDVELHVIDPAPSFDPGEHERAFAGRYVFHRDLSLNVLPALLPVDVALIDGDHNWYTVTGELEMLWEGAHAAGRPAPVYVLHDVAWPYGRRDGYYAPENIPAAHRHPCARLGIERGNVSLVAEGGINRHIWNAETEGGPRNGVLTALEDFAAAHEPELRYVVIDVFVGLAIAVELRRLTESECLRQMLDHLDDPGNQGLVQERIVDSIRSAPTSQDDGLAPPA